MLELSAIESLVLLTLAGYLFYLVTKLDSSKRKTYRLSLNSKIQQSSKIILLKSHMNRTIGLLNCLSLDPLHGVLIISKGRISTKGMLFPIDLIFINQDNKIIEIQKNRMPGEVFSAQKKHSKVLELSSSHTFSLNVDDHLEFVAD